MMSSGFASSCSLCGVTGSHGQSVFPLVIQFSLVCAARLSSAGEGKSVPKGDQTSWLSPSRWGRAFSVALSAATDSSKPKPSPPNTPPPPPPCLGKGKGGHGAALGFSRLHLFNSCVFGRCSCTFLWSRPQRERQVAMVRSFISRFKKHPVFSADAVLGRK